MSERTGNGSTNASVTAEDLTLYALDLLPAEDNTRIDALLRSSSQAREELARVRGDLATFALATPQHTPPALTRQRLMKQVARERRTVPILMDMPEDEPFTPDPPPFLPNEILRRRSQEVPLAMKQFRAVSQSQADVQTKSRPTPEDLSETPPLLAAPPSRTASMFEQYFAGEQPAGDPVPARKPVADRRPAPQPPSVQRTSAPSRQAAAFAENLPEDRYEPARDFAFRSFGEPEAESNKSRGFSLFAWSGWAAAVAMAAVALVFVRGNYSLQQKVETQSASLTQGTGNAQRADLVLQTLSSSAAQRFVLTRPDAAPTSTARIAYLPEHGSLVFQANNLEALPPYKTYELWLIPVGEGRQPIPAGTFKPDVHGDAGVVLPPLPAGTIAGNFGVTIEEADGTATPTLPILLIGQQP